jgi:hypothetical protein
MEVTLMKNEVKETKEEKFKRLAEKRVANVTKALRLLGNLANRGQYGYKDNQVTAMFNHISNVSVATFEKFRGQPKEAAFQVPDPDGDIDPTGLLDKINPEPPGEFPE